MLELSAEVDCKQVCVIIFGIARRLACQTMD